MFDIDELARKIKAEQVLQVSGQYNIIAPTILIELWIRYFFIYFYRM